MGQISNIPLLHHSKKQPRENPRWILPWLFQSLERMEAGQYWLRSACFARLRAALRIAAFNSRRFLSLGFS